MNHRIGILFFVIIFCMFFSCKEDVQVGGATILPKNQHSDTLIRQWLMEADRYMETEQYDSAQMMLNKIHEILPSAKQNPIDDYIILTRQAEVYYYNNLHLLGLQEIERALDIAESLKDSLLLADSYNFIGLFYTDMDSLDKADDSFNQAVRYTRQPPYPSIYPLLSNPHHIYGNRAELFFKKKQFNQALKNYDRSAQLAKEIGADRGEAVAYYGKGEIWQHKIADTAMYYFNLAQQKSFASRDVDIELISYSGLSATALIKGLHNEARAYLIRGWELLEKYPTINHYYTLRFLKAAIRVLGLENDQQLMIRMMQKKSQIETANISSGNVQIQQILRTGLNNEKRIARLEVTEAQQRQRLANMRLVFVLFLLVILTISFFVYRYFQNQRSAVSVVRHKLSQDLHDDIGASLSSMQIYATIAGQSIPGKPEKAQEMIEKINHQSAEVMANMNDIVWSMKTAEGSNASFSMRLKSYASAFLSENGIPFTLQLLDEADQYITGISARKNLLLIAKEAINNIAKHSGASQVRIEIRKEGKSLIMDIEDNGKGIDQSAGKGGNGLMHIQQRARELDGTSAILPGLEGRGNMIRISCPLKAIR